MGASALIGLGRDELVAEARRLALLGDFATARIAALLAGTEGGDNPFAADPFFARAWRSGRGYGDVAWSPKAGTTGAARSAPAEDGGGLDF